MRKKYWYSRYAYNLHMTTNWLVSQTITYKHDRFLRGHIHTPFSCVVALSVLQSFACLSLTKPCLSSMLKNRSLTNTYTSESWHFHVHSSSCTAFGISNYWIARYQKFYQLFNLIMNAFFVKVENTFYSWAHHYRKKDNR